MKRAYMKDIYKVTDREGKVSNPSKEYYVVFEEKKVHSATDYIVTPEGIPRAILKNIVTSYPVLVRKSSQGWEYVLLEAVDGMH